MFGITQFSAIINPPQCAILAVSSGIATIGKCIQGSNFLTSLKFLVLVIRIHSQRTQLCVQSTFTAY